MIAVIIIFGLFVFTNAACWYGLEPGPAFAASAVILYFEHKINALGGSLGMALGVKVFQPTRAECSLIFWASPSKSL